MNPSRRAFVKRCWIRLSDKAAELAWECRHATHAGADIDDPGYSWREAKARRLDRAADRLAWKLFISNPSRGSR